MSCAEVIDMQKVQRVFAEDLVTTRLHCCSLNIELLIQKFAQWQERAVLLGFIHKPLFHATFPAILSFCPVQRLQRVIAGSTELPCGAGTYHAAVVANIAPNTGSQHDDCMQRSTHVSQHIRLSGNSNTTSSLGKTFLRHPFPSLVAVKAVQAQSTAASTGLIATFQYLSSLEAPLDDEAATLVQLTMNGGRSLAAGACGLMQLNYTKATKAADAKVKSLVVLG